MWGLFRLAGVSSRAVWLPAREWNEKTTYTLEAPERLRQISHSRYHGKFCQIHCRPLMFISGQDGKAVIGT